jgi:2-amino-4-hydroxy-6-hydroxymethyldihydropteridine diphosphokinase
VAEPPPWTAYLALGSNQGDRLGYLRKATNDLDATGVVRVVARSPVFETDAVADEPQAAYLNAVLRVETTLPARRLLERCLEVERALGRLRPPGRTRAPRTIDIDLLLHDGAPGVDEPGLVVPHPRLLERPFVRHPLALVAVPGLRHPATGERLDAAGALPASVRAFSGAL